MYAIFDRSKTPLSPAFHGGVPDAIEWMQTHKTEMESADFSDTPFPETVISSMSFTRCNFQIADLHLVRFEHCTFQQCDFTSADLEGTCFDSCFIQMCNFDAAQLACCKFHDTGFVDNAFSTASDFITQFHIANLCVTFVNSWITMGAEEDEYTEILRQWKQISRRLELTRPDERLLLETLRHGFRMYELWLRDRGQAEPEFSFSSSPNEALSGPNSTQLGSA